MSRPAGEGEEGDGKPALSVPLFAAGPPVSANGGTSRAIDAVRLDRRRLPRGIRA